MAKSIEDYSKDYFAAKAKGNAAGMEAANRAANALRGLGSVVTADKDIAAVKSQSPAPAPAVTVKPATGTTSGGTTTKSTTGGGTTTVKSNISPSGQSAAPVSTVPKSVAAINYALNPADVSKYSSDYMGEINRRTALQNTLTGEKEKADNAAAIQALINARTAKINADPNLEGYKHQNIGETWDIGRELSGGNIIGGKAYSFDYNMPQAVMPPIEMPKAPAQVSASGLDIGMANGTITDTGKYYRIEKADGGFANVSKTSIEKNGWERYIDEDGYYSDSRTSNISNTNYNAINAISSLDDYRKMAMDMLKPQFDKSVDEQMKSFTERMLAQGYQGQLPGEEMRAKIMSDMQADYETQVSALAQQLMRQDVEDARWEAEFGLRKDSYEFDKGIKQQEMDWKKEERPLDMEYKQFLLNDAKKKSDENSEDRMRRIMNEKADRDWATYQRNKESELYELEIENKKLDTAMRKETDPYKLKFLEQDYEINSLNIKKIKADIAAIRAGGGGSGSGVAADIPTPNGYDSKTWEKAVNAARDDLNKRKTENRDPDNPYFPVTSETGFTAQELHDLAVEYYKIYYGTYGQTDDDYWLDEYSKMGWTSGNR